MLNITIDGPAGAGKSTVAKTLAKRLGIIYLDTGAMYRTAALFALRMDIDPNEENKIKELLPDINVDVIMDSKQQQQKMLLNGEDVTGAIRTPEISRAASDISRIPEVRLKLVELQRRIAENNPMVVDGRDIGTYVLPSAPYKFFLTASAEARAQRRYSELSEKGYSCSLEEILKDINARDNQDSTRAFAPLRRAEDAILIDSTALTADEVVEVMLEYIGEKNRA